MADRTPAGARQWLTVVLADRPRLDTYNRAQLCAFYDALRAFVASLPDTAAELAQLAGLMTRYPDPDDPDGYPQVFMDAGADQDTFDVLDESLNEWEMDRDSRWSDATDECDGWSEQDPDPDSDLSEPGAAEFLSQLIGTVAAWLAADAAR